MTSLEAYSTARAGSLRDRLAAAVGLALALALLRLPFRHTARATRALVRCAGRRPMDAARAEDLNQAVRHAGRLLPVRLACAEASLGTVMAAVLLRRHLHWCLGVRFSPPPRARHAWVALPDGRPVGEYTTGGWHYHPVLTI